MQRYSVQRLARHTRAVGLGPRPGLSFGLIHPRTGPFTGGHPDRVRAARGRWRTPVNAMQQCWKACWGQPLRSSNLLSSATLTCDDALDHVRALRCIPSHMSHFLSQLSPGHMSYSGQTAVAARWVWPRSSGFTGLADQVRLLLAGSDAAPTGPAGPSAVGLKAGALVGWEAM